MDKATQAATMGVVSSHHPSAARRVASDEAEFQALFLADYPALVRTLSLMVHDRFLAEDLAQEAYLRLLEHWSKVSAYDRPTSWVRRVAIRLAVRERTRGRVRGERERLAVVGEPVADSPDAGDPALMAAVRELSPRQRAVVVLFYFEDLPLDEIADLLGCTGSSAGVHLHRARRRLATLLEEVAEDVS
jgi:RNA polymerase sigma-70 factor (ECF subfamily)